MTSTQPLARLCDNDGLVSDKAVPAGEPGTEFDPQLTYRKLLNNLRRHTGLPPYTGGPFQCTGSVHLAGEHILCTSPAHGAALPLVVASPPSLRPVDSGGRRRETTSEGDH